MADFYADMADIARDLLAEYGVEVSLTRETPGAYSTSTGETAAAQTSSFRLNIAAFDYPNKLIDGTSILRDDKMAYSEVRPGIRPLVGDYLQWGSKRLRIMSVKPLEPALVAVLFELQLREVKA